jgi:hypothetical protein
VNKTDTQSNALRSAKILSVRRIELINLESPSLTLRQVLNNFS